MTVSFFRISASLLLACCALPSAASDPLVPAQVMLTDAVIPYSPAETWDTDLQRECDWTRTTALHLIEESNGRAVLPGPSRNPPLRNLSLVVQTMHIAGGGVWSGPKWIVIEGTLTDGGKTIGTFEGRRQSYRGSLRACTTARERGDDIADDIVKWLEHPTMNAKLGDAK